MRLLAFGQGGLGPGGRGANTKLCGSHDKRHFTTTPAIAAAGRFQDFIQTIWGGGSTKGCRLDKRTCSELPTLVYHHFAAHWQINATMQQLVDTIYADYIVPYDERDSNVKICSNCNASQQQHNFVPNIVRTNNIVASMAAAASCMAMWTEWYSSSSVSSQTHRGHGRLDLFSTPGLSCESLRGQQHHKTDTLLPMLPPLLWSHPAFLLFFFAHMRTVVCACLANVDASGILATSASRKTCSNCNGTYPHNGTTSCQRLW